ncbi:MAG: hydantoinase/oxoprolinase family protein, partial [Alphaproteobacteria bacterium]|nr:hydantoinase/oxoprolinase family protein [Alphaproteobacteria bacterium]
PAAGVFSAVGLLYANQEMNLATAFLYLVEAAPLNRIAGIYDALAADIARHMGHATDVISYQRMADMRYGGQAFELTVALPEGVLDAALLTALAERFEAEHERRYGHRFAGAYPVEIVNLRLVGTIATAAGASAVSAAADRAEARRMVYFGPAFGAPIETAILGREAIGETARPGPVIIEEFDSTTVVPPDCRVHRDGYDNLVITVDATGRDGG